MNKKKVILDVDTGIDDALAIAYAVKSKQFDILGLTTCFGNVKVEDATKNTAYIVEVLGEEIPIYEGSESPLRGTELFLDVAQKIHGKDGLGNFLPDSASENLLRNTVDAVTFIIDSINQYENEITLLFVGPLTNLAKVIQKAPEVINKVKEVVIMGGAVTVPGNVRPYAEANIYADPEAAQIVFQSGMPIKLVGLDVTMQTLLSRKYVDKWAKSNADVSRFFSKITDYYIGAYEEFKPGIEGCSLHDPLAVGVLLDPTFVETKKINVQVNTSGETIGKTFEVQEAHHITPVDVCLTVDTERFLTHFLQTLAFEDDVQYES